MATTLLNAASTTGAGTALSCSSVDKAVLTVTTSQYFSGNVVFEATIDGSTWFPYSGVLVGTKNVVDMVTGANSTRAISFDVSGLVQLRPNIKSISAGTATVVGNTVASSTSLAGSNVIKSGQKTVTTAGTRVALGAAQAFTQLTVLAKSTNTGNIFVGDSTVDSATGAILPPGGYVTLDFVDLSAVYIDSAVNGEGVSFVGTVKA